MLILLPDRKAALVEVASGEAGQPKTAGLPFFVGVSFGGST